MIHCTAVLTHWYLQKGTVVVLCRSVENEWKRSRGDLAHLTGQGPGPVHIWLSCISYGCYPLSYGSLVYFIWQAWLHWYTPLQYSNFNLWGCNITLYLHCPLLNSPNSFCSVCHWHLLFQNKDAWSVWLMTMIRSCMQKAHHSLQAHILPRMSPPLEAKHCVSSRWTELPCMYPGLQCNFLFTCMHYYV